ncbi:four helix bundle protein [Methylobacter tundripaludum]|uniref:Four helix bundle protein n=1 Tax=Methylobacter tundripaludum TaxID=173365 RepID=A0A2S6HFN4_9GAMM|nr:four helix bundle protein [Methylobacter tundripaludum]PPK76260.1 four helix bundle protein [Methylobacter tundripaludum]
MAQFEDLDVWRRSSRLCVDIYKGLATCKDYGFRDQITRSCLSIPSNIAEDFERGSDKDSNKFFYYAKGSSGELRTQIYIGIEIGYISKETGISWKNEAEHISKMLSALIKSRSA